MKNLAMFIICLFLCVPLAYGDEIDEKLGTMASVEVKEKTRQMVRAGIDLGKAMTMTRSMLQNRFRQKNIIRSQEIVIQAQKEGLPVEPILNKALEGMAKRIQQETIIRAMERVMSRYAFAFKKASEIAESADQRNMIMEQVAECASAGMTEYDINRLMYQLKYRLKEGSTDDPIDLTIETFKAVKDMARLRVPSIVGADLAIEALKHRYGSQNMAMMRKWFLKHTEDNSSNLVANVYFDTIRQGKRFESLDFINMKETVKRGAASSSVGAGGGSSGSGGGGSSGSGGGGNPGKGPGGPGSGRR
jgi:uncharacterized membrane protein YgcG